MRILSLFSGAGGLDLGLIRAGNKVIWANDIDKDAVATYRQNIGDHIICGDIKNIDIDSLPTPQVVVGGFPCQGFSLANRMRTLEDERNQLYRFFYDTIRIKHPLFFIAENVKGILSLGNGEAIKQILADFGAAGYYTEKHLVNMADYGVPQTRQRVIIIGQRKDLGEKMLFHFPQPSYDKNALDGRKKWVTIQEAIGHLPDPDTPNNLPNHIYSAYKVEYELNKRSPEQGYIQPIELQKIIIPLSGTRGVTVNDYVDFIMWNRNEEINIDRWPNCCEGANDPRMAREFLLFLTNYGYLLQHKYESNAFEHYSINPELVDEIYQIISTHNETDDINRVLQVMRESQVISEVERKRVRQTVSRPNQAHFRRDVLAACRCCVITNAEMPEILEAAHIKPFKYNGEDTIANGFAMRVDIHTLFDTGHLRISPDGDIDLSPKARNDYGTSLPRKIFLPDFTNRDFLRWRWENYDGI